MKILILAGGSGSRLWPLSRDNYSKQFLNLIGDYSFLQATILRFLKQYSSEDVFILTHSDQLETVKFQAMEVCPQLEDQIITEPERRNTGPAIVLALKYFQENMGLQDECFLFTPADSYIAPEERFLNLTKEAEKIAKQGKIVTFGVAPHKPESGYGYIKYKPSEDQIYSKIEQFVEKPSEQVAEEYVQAGTYLWNCGIFAFQMSSFIEEIRNLAPNLYQILAGSYAEALENFPTMPNISIDYALVEKSDQTVVIPLDLIWTDVGCWDSVYDLLLKDPLNNVIKGDCLPINTSNTLIIGGKKLVVSVGIEDLIIVDTDDALYVGKRNQSQKVREVVTELRQQNRKELSSNQKSFRPWGFFEILREEVGFKVKKLCIQPHQKLSLQYHHHRKEHWVVVKGIATIIKGENELTLTQGESVFIEVEEVHRIRNTCDEPLEIIETQLGERLDEEDIVRIEDDYGRIKMKEVTQSKS